MDSRFAQYQTGQTQPGSAAFPALGTGMQGIPGTSGFNLQQQGRAGSIPTAGPQRVSTNIGSATALQQQQQQQQQQLGLHQAAAARFALQGSTQQQQPQQFPGNTSLNGLQSVRTGAIASTGFPALQQAQQQQQAAAARQGSLNPLSALPPGAATMQAANAAAFNNPRNLALQGGIANLSALSSNRTAASPGGGNLGGFGAGAGSTYSSVPSGDLLSMLNKAAPRQTDEGPSFNASDFPSLSGGGAGGGQQGRHSSQDGNEPLTALLGTQQRFGVGIGGQQQQGPPRPSFGEEDFPALPGSAPHSAAAVTTAGVGGLVQQQQQYGSSDATTAYEALRLQQQRQQQLLQHQQLGIKQPLQAPTVATATATTTLQQQQQSSADRYGLLGLLGVIRMSDQDTNTLALGTDLTTLGLNLNSPEPLWKTFASPWADTPAKTEIDPKVPECYLNAPPRLQPAYFGRFQPDTLFYIFYGMPGDEAQLYAADELSHRGWYYHKELKVWLTRAPNAEPLQKTDRFERGTFFVFDPVVWDVVRKENFTVTFDVLESPPGVLKQQPGAVVGGGVPATGVPPPPTGVPGAAVGPK